MKPLAITCPDCHGPLRLCSDELSGIELKFLCPECQHKLRVDAKAADRILNCPLCSKPIKVPMFKVAKGTGTEAQETEIAESPAEGSATSLSLSLEEIDFLTETNSGTGGQAGPASDASVEA